MSNDNVNKILGGLKGLAGQILGGAQEEKTTEAQDAKASITLRYSTERLDLELTPEVSSKTVGQLFEDNASALGLPANGNIGVRSNGEAVDSENSPEAGRTYIASVSRETKGL